MIRDCVTTLNVTTKCENLTWWPLLLSVTSEHLTWWEEEGGPWANDTPHLWMRKDGTEEKAETLKRQKKRQKYPVVVHGSRRLYGQNTLNRGEKNAALRDGKRVGLRRACCAHSLLCIFIVVHIHCCAYSLLCTFIAVHWMLYRSTGLKAERGWPKETDPFPYWHPSAQSAGAVSLRDIFSSQYDKRRTHLARTNAERI